MQVSKFVLSVCATTVCAGFLSLHAQDTPAQAAARAALMQSMGEPAAAPTTPATQPPATTQAPAAPAAPATTAPAAAPVVTSPQPLDSEAQAKARDALLQAMGEPATETPPTAAVAPPAVTNTPPAVMATPSTAAAAPSTAVAAPAAPAKTSNAAMVGQEPGFPPIVAPPPPVTPAQEQQLDALLALYKANQISPEEYQKQRAAILAGPGGASH